MVQLETEAETLQTLGKRFEKRKLPSLLLLLREAFAQGSISLPSVHSLFGVRNLFSSLFR